MSFTYLYEKRTMKPVEIILNRGGRGMRGNDDGDEPNQGTV
jgi:hypothetical protein